LAALSARPLSSRRRRIASVGRPAPARPTDSLRFPDESAIVDLESTAVAMPNQTSHTRDPLRIGEWSVDRSANELRRGAETARIEPKAMEVLLALARRAGEVVSREKLLEAVWPGVVVGDEALTQCIIKLRKALGDQPRTPLYVETIPKRGYRLIAKVLTAESAAPVADPDGATPRPAAEGGRRRAIRIVVVAVAVVAAAALVAALDLGGTRRAPAAAGRPEAFDPAAEDRAGLVTLTVLPFTSIGEGVEHDYLARGIGSDLMTDLSRLSGIRVIDLTGDMSDARVARAVRYVVSGSVQLDAAVLRINVRLLDARTHQQLWSQRVERPYGDLLAIQDEITRGLAALLPGTISAAELARLAGRYTTSVAAYDDFLHAKSLFLVRRPRENEQARALYAKAVAEDPQFARAYAGLAMTYAIEGRLSGSGDAAGALARAEELAESALEIDPDLPEVHWALGFIAVQSRRFEQAAASLQQAIHLDPSYADAYALLGGIYTYTGEAGRSIPLLRTALRLDPDGGHLYFLLLGRAYLFENDLEQALINLRKAARRDPVDIETRIYLAATLVAAGDTSAARLEADEVRSHEPGFSIATWLRAYPLAPGPYRQRLVALASDVLN
jgi:DNA-binding winged helix-turn-helix (wHTH) protein/TolB-like protein/Tfp pilus assembly protein PilF